MDKMSQRHIFVYKKHRPQNQFLHKKLNFIRDLTLTHTISKFRLFQNSCRTLKEKHKIIKTIKFQIPQFTYRLTSLEPNS